MNTIGERVRTIRKQKGFSQNDLSFKAKIDIRTLQRIENGETDPRGHTIQQLASALDVTPDSLLDWQMKEDKGYLNILNLSGLSFLLFPLLGVVIPLVIWILKKDKIEGTSELGKKILNFQITWNILTFLSYLSVPLRLAFVFDDITEAGEISPKVIADAQAGIMSFALISWLFFASYVIVMVVINSIRISKNKPVKYIPAIKFMS